MPRRCAATEGADPCRFVTAIAHTPFRVYMAKTQWVPGHRGRCRRSHREWCAWVRGSASGEREVSAGTLVCINHTCRSSAAFASGPES